MLSTSIAIARWVIFCAVLVFSVIVIHLVAPIVGFTTFEFRGLTLVTACSSFVSLPLLGLFFFREGTTASRDAAGLTWLTTIWSLWLGTASLAALEKQRHSIFNSTLAIEDYDALHLKLSLVEGLAFASCFLLIIYTVAIATVAFLTNNPVTPEAWAADVEKLAAKIAEEAEVQKVWDPHARKGRQAPPYGYPGDYPIELQLPTLRR
ncbi:hypothetical protein HGRIS_009709 [Hohenbuehelia grisea]|uniref:Uncharacterized protein n=1 Tax=Hohenbuehelia grisea TaxID=104357 RepID=A0ABR3J2B3_9AGAR